MKNYTIQRNHMLQQQLIARGINDQNIIQVMGEVPRELFVPPSIRELAYKDCPLPLEHNQTISQPFIVGLMLQAARLQPDSRVLEIGTGSGYQTALLAKLCKEVYSIERIEALATKAAYTLYQLGYDNLHLRIGDGYQGWTEAAPFDTILVTAAPPTIPQTLVSQLQVEGTLIIPIGEADQILYRITRKIDRMLQEKIITVQFVPMLQGRTQDE